MSANSASVDLADVGMFVANIRQSVARTEKPYMEVTVGYAQAIADAVETMAAEIARLRTLAQHAVDLILGREYLQAACDDCVALTNAAAAAHG